MPQIRNSSIDRLKVSLAKLKTRRAWFELSWRIALLLLPWQTRWFYDQNLAGWPWEQGRWSVYFVWLPMLATLYLGWHYRENLVGKKPKIIVAIAAVILLLVNVVAVAFGTDSAISHLKIVAVAQWWIEVALLVGFFFILWSTKTARQKVLVWFVLSLLPVVGLSYLQFLMQKVIGSKWLGMAAHDSRWPGVSVVEYGEFRWLRVYGSMPHPNIWGGWLAVGILAAVSVAHEAAEKRTALFWSCAAAAISGALVLTFSRTAFLAAACGTTILAIFFFVRRKADAAAFQFGMLAFCLVSLVAGIVAFSQREVIMSRVQDLGRLETKSLEQRGESMADGLEILKHHLFFGSGVNAEQADIAADWAKKQNTTREELRLPEPIESPHNSFLLLLVDFGIFGSLVIGALCVFLLFRKKGIAGLPFLVALVLLLWFDHYGISYWSGISLVAFTLYIYLAQDPDQALQV